MNSNPLAYISGGLTTKKKAKIENIGSRFLRAKADEMKPVFEVLKTAAKIFGKN
jgi:hypothetical protein